MADTWRIDPTSTIHSLLATEVTHTVPGGAPGEGPWLALRARLDQRLATLRHDLWTSQGLGLDTGNAHANPAHATDTTTTRLNDHAVDATTPVEILNQWAAHYGVQGVLQRRRERHWK